MRRLPLNDEDIVRRYTSGETELGIALSLGVNRGTIRRRLREYGCGIRGRLETNRMLIAGRTSEQHKRNTKAAHAAVRGKKQTEQHRRNVALGVERLQSNTSPVERRFAGWLRERGLTVVTQKAIGRYNTDIAIPSLHLAVEIFGGKWHGSGRHAMRFPRRTRYLAKEGWRTFVIWVNKDYPLIEESVEPLIELFGMARWDTSQLSEYWEARGDGYLTTR